MGISELAQPTPTIDGLHVYFRGRSELDSLNHLYRVDADGRGLTQMPLPDPVNGRFAVASDGHRFVYAVPETGMAKVYDVNNGVSSTLPWPSNNPYWSPTADVIAVAMGSFKGVALYSPDGTLVRKVAAGHVYDLPYLAWSADGSMLLAVNFDNDFNFSKIDLILVATGEAIPLPFTAGGWSPALFFR